MERVRKREIDSASERDRECRARCAEQRGKAKRAGRLEGRRKTEGGVLLCGACARRNRPLPLCSSQTSYLVGCRPQCLDRILA